MKKHSFQIIVLAVAWMFISGSPSPQSLLTGLLLGAVITYVFRDLYGGDIKPLSLEKIRYMTIYTFSFLKDLLISNLGVAYLIMHPSKQKNTCIIEYRTKLESPNALTLLANSITLTPGTLVVDYREKDQMMLIHCLNLRDRQQTFKDVRKWEKLLQKIFGEKT